MEGKTVTRLRRQAKRGPTKLVDEAPLVVLPTLACRFGVNAAIILQQLHFRTRVYGFERAGRVYCGMTRRDWEQELPFWSPSTIRRVFSDLTEAGVLVRLRTAQGVFYSINEEVLCGETEQEQVSNLTTPNEQSAHSVLIYKKEGKEGRRDRREGSRPVKPKKAEDVVRQLDETSTLESSTGKWRAKLESEDDDSVKPGDVSRAWIEIVGLCKRLHSDSAPLPPPLTNKQAGQVRHLCTRLGPKTALRVVIECVPVWSKVIQFVKLHAGLDNVPKSPHLGFTLENCQYFAEYVTKGAGPAKAEKSEIAPKVTIPKPQKLS